MSGEIEHFLFIGGEADGRRIAVPIEHNHYRVPVAGSTNAPNIKIEQHFYTARRLQGENKRFTVFVFEGLSGEDIMRRLIERYKGESAK